jgi:hypothetical protein
MDINRLHRCDTGGATCWLDSDRPIVPDVAFPALRVRPLLLLLVCLFAAGCASSTPGAGGPGPFPNALPRPWNLPLPVNPPASVQGLVETAVSLRGIPYRFGGTDPRTGLDCSGLVQYVFSRFDVTVPRTAQEQYRAGFRISTSDIAAGDLLFFSTIGPGPTHVGIVVDPAKRTFVHAPGTGSAVRVDRFDSRYWRRRIVGARRLALHATPDGVPESIAHARPDHVR